MSVLTEAALRLELRAEDLDALDTFRVEAGTIVTPSAKAFLSDHKIDLVVGNKKVLSNPRGDKPQEAKTTQAPAPAPGEAEGNLPAFTPPGRYESASGGYYDEKPEHMTAIRGPKLVNKDHPIIRFRGRIDSLEARILEVQLALQKIGMKKAIADLEEVLAYIRDILRCEVLNKDLEDRILLGMDSGEIRAHSHTPKKYYGLNHFAAGLEHGEAVILFNSLRALVREAELAAYDAFKDEYGVPSRPDLLKGLNRLSSLFYVMMFKTLAKEYE